MKTKKKVEKEFSKTISFDDNLILPVIFGEHDKHLKVLEDELKIQILPRGNFLKIIGENTNVDLAENVLIKLYNQAVKSNNIDVGEIIGTINILKNTKIDKNFNDSVQLDSIVISAGKKIIKPRSKKQVDYFNMVKKKTDGFLLRSCWNGKNILSCCICCVYA